MDQEQVRQTWEAISQGNLAPLRGLLAPDAKWRAVEDGPWNCENREMILKVMGQNLVESGLAGSVEDVKEVGERKRIARNAALGSRGAGDEQTAVLGVRWRGLAHSHLGSPRIHDSSCIIEGAWGSRQRRRSPVRCVVLRAARKYP